MPEDEDLPLVINKLPELLRTKQGTTYPVDIVRDTYKYSDLSIKQLARRYDLSVVTVMAHVNAGDWETIREEYRSQVLEFFRKERGEILQDRQSILHDLEIWKTLVIKHAVAECKEHYQRWGDPYMRNADGEILLDSSGKKRVLDTIDKNAVGVIKELQELRESNGVLLQVDTERAQQRARQGSSEDPTILDLDTMLNGDLDDD